MPAWLLAMATAIAVGLPRSFRDAKRQSRSPWSSSFVSLLVPPFGLGEQLGEGVGKGRGGEGGEQSAF